VALNIVQYEEIVLILGHVPRLVDELEARHTGFPDEVLAWLRQAEKALENNRLPSASQIATCRARLVEAARGVHDKELAFVGRPTARRIKDATASMVLERSSDLLHAVIAERQAVFQEAERISRQVLAVANAKGLLQACGDGRPHQEFLQCLQEQVAIDPDLASVYAHLVGLVGKTDTLIFLDRALATVT
jgi:hypothetical protein